MAVTFYSSGADFINNVSTSFQTTGTANGAEQGTLRITGGQQVFKDSYIVQFTAIGEDANGELGQGSAITGIVVYESAEALAAGKALYQYVPQNDGQSGTVQPDGAGTGDGYISFNDVFVPAPGTTAPDLSGRLFVAPDSGVATQIASQPELTRVENIDADGDGVIEKGTTEVGNGNFTTQAFQGETTPDPGLDTDGDGVLDVDDLDDDNDGIIDTDEGLLDRSTLVSSGLTGPLHKVADGGFKLDIEVVDQDGDGALASDESDKHVLKAIEFGGQRYEDFVLPDSYSSGFDVSDGVFLADNGTRTAITNDDKDWEDQILRNAFQSTDLGEYQSVDSGVESSDFYTLSYDTPLISSGQAFIAVTERNSNNDQVVEALDADGNVLGKVLISAKNGDYFDTGHDVHYEGGQNAGISVHTLDSFVPVGSEVHSLRISFNGASGDGPDGKVFVFGDLEAIHGFRDTDGDGVADHLDLDSDNDGISDLQESGANVAELDADGNGTIDGDAFVDSNDNGIAIQIEKAAGAAGQGTQAIDTDQDGIADYLDLDSDGDTISDFIEAQPTSTYQSGDGDLRNDDTDGDGIVDLFDSDSGFGGTFAAPQDTDGDQTADYLDADSDNDGIKDQDEAWNTTVKPTGTDANNDGIDDGVGASYADPGGSADGTDQSTAESNLKNEDADSSAPDYRSVDFDPDYDPEVTEGLVTLYDFDGGSLSDEAGAERPTGVLAEGNDAEIDNTGTKGSGELHLTNESNETPGTFSETTGQQEHQLAEGRIEFVFNQDRQIGSSQDTIFDRTNAADGTGVGDLRIAVENGAVKIYHGTGTGIQEYKIADIFKPGEDVRVSYAWDDAGETGQFVVENISTGKLQTQNIFDPLTLVQPKVSGTITLGSDDVTGVGKAFDGEISYLAIYDGNDVPVANDDKAAGTEDEPVVVDILANDHQGDGPADVKDITVLEGNGKATFIDGKLVYYPGANETGPVSLSYVLVDADGDTDTATVTIELKAVNDAPVDADEHVKAEFGQPITVDVVQNSTDVDGDKVTVAPDSIGTPVDKDGNVVGKATIDPNNPENIIFTPNAGFAGDVTIPYKVIDSNGATDPSTLTVSVLPPEKPMLDLDHVDSTPGTEEGSGYTALTFGSTQPTIENDGKTVNADGVGETARFSNVATVDGQSVDLIGIVIDAQMLDANGDPTGADSNPKLSNTNPDAAGGDGTANVTFQGNSTVTMKWVVVEAGTDTPVVGDFAVLINDLDGNGSMTTYERVSVNKDQLDSYTTGSDGTQQSNIVVSEDSTTGTLTFQPNDRDPGAPGAAPDNSVALTFSNTSEFVIEYERLNDGGNVGLDGTFTSDFFTDSETVDTNLDFANRFTEGGKPVSIADPETTKLDTFGAGVSKLSINPAEKTFEDGADEQLIFNGDNGQQLVFELTGIAQDSQQLTVDGVNFKVTYNGDSFEIYPEGSVTKDTVATKLLQGVQYQNTSEMPEGVDGLTRIFEVSATNSFGDTTETAESSILVVGENDAPIAEDDKATTLEDQPVTIKVLGNDTDPDGDPLKIVKLGQALDENGNPVGNVIDNGDGTVTFDPPPGFAGQVTIQYVVSDGNGGSDSASVFVTVEKDTDGDGIADIRDIDDDNDGILDVDENLKGDIDTDGDGIINSLDLDSDNDGISDLVESGADAALLDADGNGTIDGKIASDGDQDGLADIVEKINGADTGTAPVDSDKDGFADYKDLDSDNDGISDYVEGQTTKDFKAYDKTDSDGDGIIDSADAGSGFGGAFNTPTDTDGDERADYLDRNSDNDPRSDSEESGLTLTGTSTNGIDDGAGVTFDNQDGAVTGDGLAGLSQVFTNDDANPNELDFRAFPCFTAGTLIATIDGQTPVENLQVGDRVLTLDSGFQTVRWIGQRTVPGVGKMAPVRIVQGTLGTQQDLLVSPQHRMLVSGWQAELISGESEVLVPAKHLVNDLSIVREQVDEVTYVHVLFDQHEVIWANGSPSESFHPAQVGLGLLEDDTRQELFELFPELAVHPSTAYGPTARHTLKQHEAALLVV